MQELKRITVPFKHSKNIEKLYQEKDVTKSVKIIACSNRTKNFYDTTVITKWNEMFLASLSWRNPAKSLGDHFTINPISQLPAFVNNTLKFKDMGLKPELITAVNNIGIVKPTNIQGLTMPTIMEGTNTIIGGETGGGKTLAFVLPILNKIFGKEIQQEGIASPSAIIIAPTWELCHQLNEVITSISEQLSINSTLFKFPKDLHGKISILVSTPHNFFNAIDADQVKLKNLSCIVMDEADMLFDSSFNQLVQGILSKTSIQTTRPFNGTSVGSQLILCNATSPEHLEKSFGEIVPLDSFAILCAENMQRLIPTVSHKFIRCSKTEKTAMLIGILKKYGVNSCPNTIVFCNTHSSIARLSPILTENGVEHTVLYKQLSMEERRKSFERFQNGEVKVLLSTDLGSRGLDTVKAKHIINFEFPRFISDYLHRAGRTGRVGCAAGKVTNLISARHEVSAVQCIESSVRQNIRMKDLDSSMINKLTSDDE